MVDFLQNILMQVLCSFSHNYPQMISNYHKKTQNIKKIFCLISSLVSVITEKKKIRYINSLDSYHKSNQSLISFIKKDKLN